MSSNISNNNRTKIDSIYHLFKTISEYSVPVMGYIILIMTAFIGIEVIIRKFFALSLTGVEEFSGYSMAIISVWGLSYTLINKGHIRIDFFYRLLSNNHLKRLLDIISIVSMIVFVSPLTYFAYRVFSRSWARLSKANTSLATPLWIPQVVWFAGFLLFLILIILIFIKLVVHLAKKEYQEAEEVYGLKDEVQEELDLQNK